MDSDERFGYEEFGLGLLVGLAVGGFLGLLFAPQTGVETRKQIAGCAANLKVSTEDLLEEARKNVEAAAVKAEELLGTQKKSVAKKIEELKAELERYELNEA
ncbi:MAG: YtxH domain-containing protein [Candidatus Subteraquimicrobiales bacterium]|nr:YtxH domain-containing protein [Candidatus Subteraquimicrobiales bacterium]